MKRIAFFTETEWAFGVIHYELTKNLFVQGINANVLPWNKAYSRQEISELCAVIDYFVSTPYGVAILIDSYGVKPEQCIVVAHAVLDIECLKTFLPENVQRLYAYSAVSNWLIEQSQLHGIDRVPSYTPIGINYLAFATKPSKELRIVGYAGAINPDNIHRHIKRPWLVEKAAQQSGLAFQTAHGYHNSFVTMPGFYNAVDAVVVASTEEGAGLPALEASAAGKLVISTPVGLWLAKAGSSGHTVPIEENAFLKSTISHLEYYRDNATAYHLKCLDTQEHAKRYDWANVIHHWVNLIK
jgi:glycosyltransferase involved in cell wall biosynthesis